MKVYIGADHRGFKLKEELKKFLSDNNEVTDVGALELNPEDDYVEFAEDVARNVASEQGSRGIVICGSGAGVSVTANKIKDIRASIGFSNEQVKSARNDDDVNVLALSSDLTNLDDAKLFVETFLQTQFENTENHTRRIDKIKQLEG